MTMRQRLVQSPLRRFGNRRPDRALAHPLDVLQRLVEHLVAERAEARPVRRVEARRVVVAALLRLRVRSSLDWVAQVRCLRQGA